jgi:uncharacterized membrane protein
VEVDLTRAKLIEKNRLEAFSDGVVAIIITIMVLELKVPHGESLPELIPLWPVFLSYVLSFVYVGIYWNNHHHLLQATHGVEGPVLWFNLHLLFWLSLLPFTTGWMGENHFARWPTFLYGVNLLLCALAWVLLQTSLVRCHGPDSLLAQAIGRDLKGRASPLLYVLGIGVAGFGYPNWAIAFFAIVALLWLVPDRRLERALTQAGD